MPRAAGHPPRRRCPQHAFAEPFAPPWLLQFRLQPRLAVLDRVIDGSLRDALAQHVKGKMLPAAAALLKQTWKFDVADGDAVHVTTETGTTGPLDETVRSWVEADDVGGLYASRKPAKPDTPIQNLINKLSG